jgi:hypothetical protein
MTGYIDSNIKAAALAQAENLGRGLEDQGHAWDKIAPHIGGLALLSEQLKELHVEARLRQAREDLAIGIAFQLAAGSSVQEGTKGLSVVAAGNSILERAAGQTGEAAKTLDTNSLRLGGHMDKLDEAAGLAGRLLTLLGEVATGQTEIQQADKTAGNQVQTAINDVTSWAHRSSAIEALPSM